MTAGTHQPDSQDTDTDSDSASDDESIQGQSLLERIMSSPTDWESDLWHRITCHSRHDDLNQHLITGTHITACSDAAVDTANFSTFSWIIYSDRALWQGEGIVPGLVEDVYSGRSEAFGVLTLLQFLSNYIANYPNTYPTPPTLTIFCDNQGVLDRINRLPVNQPLQPRPTTANDYDVYIAIRTALHDLAPTTVQLRHVKGHQDQNPHQQLSLPACLNIECDKRAVEYLTIARRLKPKPNPKIPQCYPHLQINGQIIV